MENRKITEGLKLFIVGALLSIMLSAFVNALAVGTDGSEVGMLPGESKESVFLLQNYGEDAGDIVVEAEIEAGSEFISLTGGTSFNVAAGGNAEVPVRYSVPVDAGIGETYNVEVLFRVVSGSVGGESGSEGSTVGFAISPKVSIDLVVESEAGTSAATEEQPQSGSSTWIWWVVGIIALILIIWLVMRRKNEGVRAV